MLIHFCQGEVIEDEHLKQVRSVIVELRMFILHPTQNFRLLGRGLLTCHHVDMGKESNRKEVGPMCYGLDVACPHIGGMVLSVATWRYWNL